ncbi:MAG: PEGA domain-containing protein [Chromatiales bacterium]|nr:PEGA domain-containing protein [Chromatiales bacterium]
MTTQASIFAAIVVAVLQCGTANAAQSGAADVLLAWNTSPQAPPRYYVVPNSRWGPPQWREDTTPSVKNIRAAGNVRVTVEPSSARVLLDGSPLVPNQDGELARGVFTGSHTVEAYAAGYRTEQRTVTVGAGAQVNVDLRLERTR